MASNSLRAFGCKLERFELDEAARSALLRTVATTRSVDAGRQILRAEERPHDIFVVLQGMVARHKMLPDGRRQIVSFGIAGDLCNAQSLVAPVLDFGVSTLSSCTLAIIPVGALRAVVDKDATIARALWRESVAEATVEREWVLNVGQRPALERMSHMLCEMAWRTNNAGLADGETYSFPLTQVDLGDALGLSVVHVNRTLQNLRGRGLVRFIRGKVTVLNPSLLCILAGFNPRYLAAEPV